MKLPKLGLRCKGPGGYPCPQGNRTFKYTWRSVPCCPSCQQLRLQRTRASIAERVGIPAERVEVELYEDNWPPMRYDVRWRIPAASPDWHYAESGKWGRRFARAVFSGG